MVKLDKNTFLRIGLIVLMGIMIYFFTWITQDGNYINRPFSECEQNFSVSYGAFQSCGDLMSEDTAFIGIWSIFIGFLLILFVILPMLKRIKDEQSEDLRTKKC